MGHWALHSIGMLHHYIESVRVLTNSLIRHLTELYGLMLQRSTLSRLTVGQGPLVSIVLALSRTFVACYTV